MKELYTLSPELLTQRPRVQVGGQIFEVDDRTATVRQMMEITRQQLPSDQQMDQVLRLALGKENFAKLEAMELPFAAYLRLFELVIQAMTGEEEQPGRFPG